MTYTLLQVRDILRAAPDHGGNVHLRPGDCADLADAIDANLSQPQPVAQGEAVAYVNPEELAALVRDAKKFGKTQYCIDAFAKPSGLNTAPLYATPTLPTGHRVVPVEVEDLSNCTDGFGINKTVNAMLADALRFLAKPGQKVIWRGSFRWFDDDGVLSNHYDGMDIDHLARDFGYEVHYDANHAALVSKKEAPDAGGV